MISEDLQELELSLNKLAAAGKQKGLNINVSKIEVLRNKHVDLRQVIVGGHVIKEVQNHIYLGKGISLAERDIASEIYGRIQTGWKSLHVDKAVLKITYLQN